MLKIKLQRAGAWTECFAVATVALGIRFPFTRIKLSVDSEDMLQCMQRERLLDRDSGITRDSEKMFSNGNTKKKNHK